MFRLARGRERARAGRIVLHIGRNKAGSTTLQDLCVAHRAALLAQGVDYRPFGHLADSLPGVPGFARFEALAAHAAAHPHLRVLVSNEFMFAWPDAYTEDAGRALAACEVEVVAYVRPYDAWLVSAYAEETRRGMNSRDIDGYLAAMSARVSAWPHLKAWGETFGWGRLRVRTLDARGLKGGALETDFAAALGVDLPPPASRSNVAPSWIELELVRALCEGDGDADWAGVPREVAEPLRALLAHLAREAAPTPYLTLAQRRALTDLYQADLARLHAATGATLPFTAAAEGPERPFVPCFAEAPADLRAAFFDRASDAAFAAEHPAASARAAALAAALASDQR